MRRRRFLDIAIPERFVLEFLTDTGEWLDHGLYDADSFERGDDGTYACLGHGSPLYLRCRAPGRQRDLRHRRQWRPVHVPARPLSRRRLQLTVDLQRRRFENQ